MSYLGHEAHMREIRNSYNIFVRKPEGFNGWRSSGRPRHRSEGITKMCPKVKGVKDTD
jgi:hypothetical protein